MKNGRQRTEEGIVTTPVRELDFPHGTPHSVGDDIRKRAAELIQDPQVLGWFNTPIIVIGMKPRGIPDELWDQMGIEQKSIVVYNMKTEAMREYI